MIPLIFFAGALYFTVDAWEYYAYYKQVKSGAGGEAFAGWRVRRGWKKQTLKMDFRVWDIFRYFLRGRLRRGLTGTESEALPLRGA